MSGNTLYDPACSIALSASAGSGKTYALTTRLLTMLLGGVHPSQILAITFTNAAARDIRDELFNRLDTLKAGENAEVELFSDTLGVSRERVSGMAAGLRSALMRQFSLLQISTIHSFFARIIRCFPRETGMVDFTVIDDPERDSLIKEAIVRFFDRMHHDRRLFNRVYSLLMSRGDRGTAAAQRIRTIYDRVHAMFYVLEPFVECMNTDVTRVEEEYFRYQRYLQSPKYIRILETLAGLVSAHHAEHGEKRYTRDFVTQLEEFMRDRSIRNLAESPFFRDYGARGLKNYLRSMCKRLPEEQASRFERLFHDSWRGLSRYFMSEMHHNVSTWLNVYALIQRIYDVMKAPAHVVDFTDIEIKARDLLVSLRDFSFFQHRIESWIRYILIDEFQDTSELEWSALYPLVQNCLKSGGALFYVGDVKQSIYRWRGGEPNLFSRIRDELGIQEEQLHYTYRQNGVLLDFVNRVFLDLHEETGGRFGYAEQHLPPGSEGKERGYVHIRSFRDRDVLIDGLLRHLHDLTLQGVGHDDIAILCRKNSEVEEIEALLRQEHIRFNSAGRTRLLDDYSIMDLVNTLHFVREPEEPLYLAGLLRAPLFRVHYDELLALQGDWRLHLHRLRDVNRGLYERILHIIRLSRYSSVSRFMRGLYEEFDLFSVYPDKREQLLGFLDLVYGFEEGRDHCRLEDFIRHLEEHSEYITLRSGDHRGVTVQTIHTAKGLEYHTVIVPFVSQRARFWLDGSLMYSRDEEARIDRFILATNPYPSYYPDQEVYGRIREENDLNYVIDEINTLYVALTRARENLIVLPHVGGRYETLGEVLLRVVGGQPDEQGEYEVRIGEPVESAVRREEPPRKYIPVAVAGSKGADAAGGSENHDLAGSVSPLAEEPAGGAADRRSNREGMLRGLLVHSVLEQIRRLPVDDEMLERMLRIALAREGRTYTRVEREGAVESVRQVIKDVVTDPRLEKYFSESAFSEVGILSTGFQNLLGRIDRIYIDEQIGVIDFKTNPVTTAEELNLLTDKLEEQVVAYCLAAEEIFSGKWVRGYLYFTSATYEQRLVQVYEGRRV